MVVDYGYEVADGGDVELLVVGGGWRDGHFEVMEEEIRISRRIYLCLNL